MSSLSFNNRATIGFDSNRESSKDFIESIAETKSLKTLRYDHRKWSFVVRAQEAYGIPACLDCQIL